MPDVFISYRRKPSSSLAQLLQVQLKNNHRIDAYLDTSRTDSTRVQFPDRLMQAIAESPTFICLLGDSTLDSEWVQKEIQQAYDLKKHCIPVFQESYIPSPSSDPAIEYLLNFDGVHIFDVKNVMINESISKIAHLIVRQKKVNGRVLLVGILMLMLFTMIGVFSFINNSIESPDTPTQTTSVAIVTDDSIAPTDTPLDTATITPTSQPIPTATLNPSPPDIGILTPEDTTTYIVKAGDTYASIARRFNVTFLSLINQNAIVNPDLIFVGQRVTVAGDGIVPIVATQSEPELALTSVRFNSEWVPIERNFDGVAMVLVPSLRITGYMMGDNNGQDDEKPAHEAFFEPFWIDKYEVTQAQFAQFNGQKANANQFSGDNRPVERITWFEAKTFCELRGMRLLTEAEWEYAARGMNNWLYPWGYNEFIADNAVFADNSNGQTADVGSRSGGASWVGAMDMSGNVWEWVSSLYQPYPYTAEDESDTNTDSIRVFRGGAWNNGEVQMRSTYRGGNFPTTIDGSIGFRCARDYEG
ncbi:MAG: SUMF1/EgtB/PvdO family nonheme iron enzyme [bacterium]|nr:SUMF1/EgtB/PvdO family nonheme iron enzyme [bacterium]